MVREPCLTRASLTGLEVRPRLATWLTTALPLDDPGITPNKSGLPGLGVIRSIVGALLTWGHVACVAGLWSR